MEPTDACDNYFSGEAAAEGVQKSWSDVDCSWPEEVKSRSHDMTGVWCACLRMMFWYL